MAVTLLTYAYSLTIMQEQLFLEKQAQLCEIFKKKNKAYGSSYQDYGSVGIIIRMNDKINRLRNITKNSVNIDCTDESLCDTIADMGNYCILALLEIDRLEKEQDS